MMVCERTILADLAPWSRKSHATRALLRSGLDRVWIRIGVQAGDRRLPLCDVRADPDTRWLRHADRTLRTIHGGGEYVDEYAPRFLQRLHAVAASARAGLPMLPSLLEIRTFLLDRLHLADRLGPCSLESSVRSSDPSGAHPGGVWAAPGSRRHLPHPDGVSEVRFRPLAHPRRPGGFHGEDSALDLLFTLGPDSWSVLDALPDALEFPEPVEPVSDASTVAPLTAPSPADPPAQDCSSTSPVDHGRGRP